MRDCSIASGSRAYFYASGKLRKIQSSSDISCSLCIQALGQVDRVSIVWTVKIYAAFWLIFSASTPSDLQLLQELGEGLGHCLSKRAHSNGSDLVVKFGVDCSREVDTCLQNG